MLATLSPRRITIQPKPFGASNGTETQPTLPPVPLLAVVPVPLPVPLVPLLAPPVVGMLAEAVPGTTKVCPPWKVRLRFLVTNDCSHCVF